MSSDMFNEMTIKTFVHRFPFQEKLM